MGGVWDMWTYIVTYGCVNVGRFFLGEDGGRAFFVFSTPLVRSPGHHVTDSHPPETPGPRETTNGRRDRSSRRGASTETTSSRREGPGREVDRGRNNYFRLTTSRAGVVRTAPVIIRSLLMEGETRAGTSVTRDGLSTPGTRVCL